MKNAGKPSVVINVNGNNNKVTVYREKSQIPAIVVSTLFITITVLAVSLCCPELLAETVRWIIGLALNS